MTNLFNYLSNWKLKYICALIVLLSLGVGNAWGTVLFHETFGSAGSASDWNYNNYSVKSGVAAVYANITSYSVTNARICKNSMGYGTTTGSKNTDGSAMMSTAGNTATLIIGPLAVGSYTSLSVTHYLGKSSGGSWGANDVMTLKYSTDNSTYTNVTRTGTTPTGAVNNSSSGHGYTQVSYSLPAAASSNTLYLKFEFYVYQTNKSGTEIGQCYIDEVELTGTAAVTCSNDPTVGAASIKGTFNGGGVTSLTNISDVFSAASSAAGSATCSITEYGFVWSDGSTNTNPVIDGSGVTKENHSGAPSGDGGSFSSNMVGTWVVDHTYYYKAYVKNGRPATAYSTASPAASFTVRGITFDSNDGSSVSTKYIRSGGVMTAPTAPTKDGNVFAGWYSNEELTSAVDWSSAVTSSATYYAKWYSVTVNVKDEAGNTLSGSGKPTASCTGTTLSTSAGSEKYVFKEWQVSNTASLGSDATTASNSLTSITGNVTVTAVYHAPIALTKGTNTGAGTFNFSSNPIGYGETLTITCAADASHKGSPTVTASGTHGTITVVSATSVTIANVQSAMTVNISYAAKEAAVVKLHVAGSTSTISGSYYEGDSYDLPEEATECPDMGLYGWYEESYSDEDDAPTGSKFHSKGASVTLDAGDNDFYAVYATANEHSSVYFTEITSESALTSGDYLIGALTGPWCMKTSKGTTYMNEIGMGSYNTDQVIDYNSNADIIWVITRSGSNVTIKGNDNNKYLAITSGVIGVQNDSYSWTFDYGTTKTDSWTFTSVTETTQQLIYSGYDGFCAGTAQSSDISLYKRNIAYAGPYTTSPSCQTYTLATAVTPSATGTAEAGKTVLAEGKTTTVTATPIDNYSFAYWTISGGGSTMSNTTDGKSTDNPVTVTMGNAETTITAHFTENAYHSATFMNNGEPVDGYEDVKTYDGTRPTPPTLTSSNACDPTECNQFYGWVADGDKWEEATTDISGKTIYRSANSLPNVSGADVTYHAVWAKGSAAPAVTTPTPIAAWNKNGSGISASTNYSANTGTGTLTSNIDMSGTGYSFMNTNTGISTAPVITLSGLNLSGASTSTVNISFYTRGSKTSAGTLTVEYSSNNGSSYSTAGTVTIEDGIINHHEITGIPKTTNQIRLTHALSTGSFSIGTFMIYEPVSGTWNFTELTSANTSGWTTTDWEGDYIITNGSTTALNGYYFEDNKCLVTVSPSTGVISLNANDAGNAFRITYSAGNSGYSVQGIGGGLYLKYKNNSVDRSESAENYYSMGYNSIIYSTLIPLQWNSTKFGFYSSSYTSLKLYKTLSTYTKWRISCCEKHDITKDGDPAGTVTGGTFTVDKTSACEGATITLSVTSTSSGYNFDEWEVTGDESSDKITVTDNQFTMPDEAVTVTAVFVAAHTTTVTLNAQGGVGGTSSVTATVNLPMPDATMPTKSGYDFGGYYLATNGSGTQYYDADGNSAHNWDDGESETAILYAKWTSAGYTVTLNNQSATSAGTTSVSVTYGTNTNLTSAITCPEKTNKVFGGYWTSANSGATLDTKLIDADGNWLPSVTSYTDVNRNWLYANDLTLYAKWSDISYTNYRTTCGPEIEITGGPVYLTSYPGCEVLTTGNITVSSANWQSSVGAPKFLRIKVKDQVSGTTYAFTSSNIASSEWRIYNSTGNGGGYADLAYIALPTDGTNPSYTFRIAYTPAAGVYNTLDHYTLEVEVMDNSSPNKKALTLATEELYGRTLPEQFVIATKKDDQWYALPNDLASTSTAARAVKAIPITVDNSTTPTSALLAPENTLYKATGYYTSPEVAYRNRSGVRFTRNGSQYLQVSTTVGTNVMWLSTTGGTDVQDWYLNSGSDFQNYEVKIDPRGGSDGYRAKKIRMNGYNFGFYAAPEPDDNPKNICLLPVMSVLQEANVVEWGKHKAIIEVDATTISATKVIGRIGETATVPIALEQTMTSVNRSATKYNYTINFGNTFDFTAEKDEKLYLDWLNSSGTVVGISMIDIPWIIDGTKTMSVVDATKGHWETEVHVLPGAVLTADGGSFGSSTVVVNQLEIYPGATVNVTTGTLTATNLILRNGWTRAGEKAYDVARLYITPTNGNLSVTTAAYADWYIDFDQYYPIAVPWEVNLGENDGSTICYKNSKTKAIIGLSTTVRLRYYDGESRAKGKGDASKGENWKHYGESGCEDIPETLEPSKAYAMTAKRPTGKAFSIIRMPLTIPSTTWTSAGEKGSVDATHKDQVTVTAYNNDAGDAAEWARGWNFIANPYMSLYQGPITHSETDEDNDYDIAYVNIPDINFNEYEQLPAATTKLKPASGFLIQTGADGTLTFGTTHRKASAPSFRTEKAPKASKQKAYILLSDQEANDMMGLIISDQYTAEYEMNADLEKLLGDGTSLKTYMRYNEMNMAYVAINETLAKEWIPVSVRIPETGEYTFSIHEASIADELEGVYLIDYANGDQVTNLLADSYTFTANAGTISNRFAINAKVGERETPTAIDVVGVNNDSTEPVKFLWHDKVFIWFNGVIYDATGKKVR